MTSNVSRFPARNLHGDAAEERDPRRLRSRAKEAADVAARHAAAVDRDARFPSEAFAAIREQKLLGLLIPAALGGEEASAADVAEVCYILGGACASTAMIFAMHQVKVACLARHSRGVAWQENLQRRIAAEQLLMASSTTEGSNGGNVRSSEAPVRTQGQHISLERATSCISYGEHADGIVTTARRNEAAAGSDQVLVAFLKDDYSLERTQSWDTLGMRGTCSVGFILRAKGVAEQVLADPYERIHSQTMVPFAHMFWSAAWAGLAAGAVQRARDFVRAAARASGGKMPPAAAHLTRARLSLETLRGAVHSAIESFERRSRDSEGLDDLNAQTALNLLKVEASELAVATVLSAMRACGLSGYRNDTEFTLGRHLRDVLSSPIMINNDRILSNIATASLMSAVPATLRD
ncbi:MAG TPA: acyl-CoA dehydrogenase family protein [Roseiarcus sp.]|nr:acyl-CoA dehydrogenase family protein [Roseiarcus sp.]